MYYIMGIIKFYEGCNTPACTGPPGNYYTLFGTELRFLTMHIIFSIFLGAIISGVLSFLRKEEKISISFYLIMIIQVITTILFFFLLAYFFPMVVVY